MAGSETRPSFIIVQWHIRPIGAEMLESTFLKQTKYSVKCLCSAVTLQHLEAQGKPAGDLEIGLREDCAHPPLRSSPSKGGPLMGRDAASSWLLSSFFVHWLLLPGNWQGPSGLPDTMWAKHLRWSQGKRLGQFPPHSTPDAQPLPTPLPPSRAHTTILTSEPSATYWGCQHEGRRWHF